MNQKEQNRLREQIKEAGLEAIRTGGEIIVDRSNEDLPGTCVGPALFYLKKENFYKVDSYSRIELFGPVIHLTSFSELDEAIKIFNATEYALTGGIFSQSQDDLDYLTDKLECGNLYINRTITGARVGIEPFGGFKLSGTGPKAGSTKYLESFHVHPIVSPTLTNITRLGSEDKLNEANEVLFAGSSELPTEMLLPRIEKGMDYILKNFEFLYQGIYGDKKSYFYRFKNFISGQLVTYVNKNSQNVSIPGQISVTNNLLSIDRLLVVAYEPRAYFSSLMSVVAALSKGVGVSVVCRNDDAFFWWSKIVTYFNQAGIDSSQIRVQQISAEAVKNTLESHVVSLILVDGKLKQFQELSELAYNHNYTESEMIKFLTPFDSPNLNSHKAYLDQFTKKRSLAINTMRHGAPLELDL